MRSDAMERMENGFGYSKINLGCGDECLPGWLNCDKFPPPGNPPAFALDLLDKRWPFDDETFEEARLYHVIEHLPWKYHAAVFAEIHRILKPDGILTVAYPEFEPCVKNFLADKNNQKYGFWLQCLYGEQTAPGMFHLAPAERGKIESQLRSVGFFIKSYQLKDDFNGEIVCVRTI